MTTMSPDAMARTLGGGLLSFPVTHFDAGRALRETGGLGTCCPPCGGPLGYRCVSRLRRTRNVRIGRPCLSCNIGCTAICFPASPSCG